MGASIINADEVVSELWQNHEPLRNRAKERWGEDLFDKHGLLRRDVLCRRVFGNVREYQELCGMVHPLVKEILEEAYRKSRGWFVAEIPLLFEGGVPWWVDTTIYVSSPFEERLKRNLERGKSREWFEMMESRLLSSEERASRARVLVENNASREIFAEKGRALGKHFRDMSSVVEMRWCCSSSEAMRKGRYVLENKGFGIFFRFEGGDSPGESCLSWMSLEKHFPCIKKILEEAGEEENSSFCRLWAVTPRRMNLEALEKIVEVCD